MTAFESDVIPDSGKTLKPWERQLRMFESDVIPDSGKTMPVGCRAVSKFESDVIPDSGKTPGRRTIRDVRLRVM